MFCKTQIASRLFLLFGFFVFIAFSAAKTSAFPDFDSDGKADFGVFRPAARMWYSYSTKSETFSGMEWGLKGDEMIPADYDGDGLTDVGMWRPDSGMHYVNYSKNNHFFSIQWGTGSFTPFGNSPDVPVPGDYDGDGLCDIAVWRPSDGIWYVLVSSENFNHKSARYFQWGTLGDIPVPADYDGDSKTDFAVFRSTENRWYIFQSQNNQWFSTVFGQAGDDLLVPADYTGDGRADLAVYRGGVWIIQGDAKRQTEVFQFGASTDMPVPADYDNDKRADMAVFRNGTWFFSESSTQKTKAFYFGQAGDIPLNSINVKPSIVPVP